MNWSQFLPIEPCAKARPRVTRHGTYMPPKYQQWRKRFVALIKPPAEPMTGRLRVTVNIYTASGRMRPDLDNCFGAVADALQDARVIANDRDIEALWCGIHANKNSGISVAVEVTR